MYLNVGTKSLKPLPASSGRNDKGQLGHGDTKRLEAPKVVEGLADQVIVSAACGRNHTLALTGGRDSGQN